jgi:hypothetical protein
LKGLIGCAIEFRSLKNKKTIVAKLLGFSAHNIQVELLRDLTTETRFWYTGEVRLFDIDKITDLEKIPMPEKLRREHTEKVYRARKSKISRDIFGL